MLARSPPAAAATRSDSSTGVKHASFAALTVLAPALPYFTTSSTNALGGGNPLPSLTPLPPQPQPPQPSSMQPPLLASPRTHMRLRSLVASAAVPEERPGEADDDDGDDELGEMI